MHLPHDITRCVSPTCYRRWRCSRYCDITVNNRHTSWADLTPAKGEECPGYIEFRADVDQKVKFY